MNQVLFISPDPGFLAEMGPLLKSEGYLVQRAHSLEDPFLESGRAAPYLVVIDAEALSTDSASGKILDWFHRRSPVWIVGTSGNPEVLGQCDRCLPRTRGETELLSFLRASR